MDEPTESPEGAAPWNLTRTVLTPLAVVVGLVLLAAGLFALGVGRLALTAWGLAWSAEALLLGVALLTAFLQGPRLRVLRVTSVVCLLVLVLVRVASRGETRGAALVVLDRDGQVTSSARLLDRLFEERDAAIVGSRAFVAVGAVSAREFPTLPDVLDTSYAALAEDGSTTDAGSIDASALGTPIPATLLGLQTTDASDVIVVEPAGATRVSVSCSSTDTQGASPSTVSRSRSRCAISPRAPPAPRPRSGVGGGCPTGRPRLGPR